MAKLFENYPLDVASTEKLIRNIVPRVVSAALSLVLHMPVYEQIVYSQRLEEQDG
jgi:hypothetical protein